MTLIAYIESNFNAYLMPILTFINIFNNLLLLLIFFKNHTIQRCLPKTVYINYIAMAVNDINNAIFMQLSHFLGILGVQ